MYDYGAIMLNPIFNLSSFFIGMFFGLVNYSIQRGVNYSKADNYQRIYTIENFVQKNEKSENELNQSNNLTKMPTMLSKNQISSEEIELASFSLMNKKNEFYQDHENCNIRSYSDTIQKNKNDEDEKTNNNDIINNNMESFIIPYNPTIQIEEFNQHISEMPFLILPA